MVEERVRAFMVETNRPWNVQGVTDMLAQYGCKKPQVERALLALAEGGKVTIKEFGKAKIYMAPQEGLPELSKEEMDEKKRAVADLTAQVKQEGELVRELQKGLSSLQSNLTLEQAREKAAGLKREVAAAADKLAGLQGGAVLVSAADRAKAEKNFASYMQHWSKRRRVFREIWETMSENIEGNRQQVLEEVGVETDDGAGCDYGQLAQLLPSSKRTR